MVVNLEVIKIWHVTKWLERCEVCGDIRASHTNGIDHKFEVDATGTEFLDPKYLNELSESALFKKSISVEIVRLETMREAHTWWDRKHAGTHGRKYWKDMNIRERQKTILAFEWAIENIDFKYLIGTSPSYFLHRAIASSLVI